MGESLFNGSASKGTRKVTFYHAKYRRQHVTTSGSAVAGAKNAARQLTTSPLLDAFRTRKTKHVRCRSRDRGGKYDEAGVACVHAQNELVYPRMPVNYWHLSFQVRTFVYRIFYVTLLYLLWYHGQSPTQPVANQGRAVACSGWSETTHCEEMLRTCPRLYICFPSIRDHQPHLDISHIYSACDLPVCRILQQYCCAQVTRLLFFSI